MASNFHRLKIRDVRRETQDCVSISFEVPESLQHQFRFKQGQNLTLRLHDGEREIRRSYSICSSPLDNELRIAVKEVPGGTFSTFANRNIKVGDELDVMTPAGKFFTSLNSAASRSYLALAAGSGITPILSIIKTTLATEPKSHFTLVFGNQTRNHIIFRESLEAIKNRYIDRFQLIHIFSRERVDSPVNAGRIDATKCRELNGKIFHVQSMDQVFLCGPLGMIESARSWLHDEGTAPEHIHFELFNAPTGSGASRNNETGASTFTEDAMVSILVDGSRLQFPLAWNGPAILDVALAAGADLPFACKGGVCASCKAKLIAGLIAMDANYALEADELAAGYILTCQSHPRSAIVEIDFDSK